MVAAAAFGDLVLPSSYRATAQPGVQIDLQEKWKCSIEAGAGAVDSCVTNGQKGVDIRVSGIDDQTVFRVQIGTGNAQEDDPICFYTLGGLDPSGKLHMRSYFDKIGGHELPVGAAELAIIEWTATGELQPGNDVGVPSFEVRFERKIQGVDCREDQWD